MPVKSLSAKVPFPDEAPDTVKLKSVSQFGNAEIEKKYPGFGIRLVSTVIQPVAIAPFP
jgi:hypothetical protein